MRILTLLIGLSLSAAVSAQTLPLSQSSTFQSKANVNNPSFSGNATFAGSVAAPNITISGGNTAFGLGNNSGRPYITFDGQPSRIEFDSTGNYVFYLGNKKVARIDGAGNLYLRGTTSLNLGNNCC